MRCCQNQSDAYECTTAVMLTVDISDLYLPRNGTKRRFFSTDNFGFPMRIPRHCSRTTRALRKFRKTVPDDSRRSIHHREKTNEDTKRRHHCSCLKVANFLSTFYASLASHYRFISMLINGYRFMFIRCTCMRNWVTDEALDNKWLCHFVPHNFCFCLMRIGTYRYRTTLAQSISLSIDLLPILRINNESEFGRSSDRFWRRATRLLGIESWIHEMVIQEEMEFQASE